MGWLAEAIIGAVGWLLSALPRSWLLGLGATIGWFWFYVIPIRRRWCQAHLAAALPELGPSERRQVARRVFVEQVRNTLEMLAWRKLWRGDVPVSVEGLEHFQSAADSGRPVIVVSAHLGNFDLVACYAGREIAPIKLISKQLGWRALNQAWMETRARFGVEALPPEGTFGAALAALRDGEVVAAVMDQHAPEKRAVEARFFGIPARTSAVVGTLAVRTTALVVPVYGRRTDAGHRIAFRPALEAPAEGDVRERIRALTVSLQKQLEHEIRKEPWQWLWLHRRWKTEDGEPLVRP